MQNYVIKQDQKGLKEVIWQNTAIDKPSRKEVDDAADKEFPGVPPEKLYLMSGIMSLTLKETPSIL